MEVITKKIIDMLTENGVSILTRKYVELDGVLTQVGENHRCAYDNSEESRKLLQENEPDYVVKIVLAQWDGIPIDGSMEEIEKVIMEGVNEV